MTSRSCSSRIRWYPASMVIALVAFATLFFAQANRADEPGLARSSSQNAMYFEGFGKPYSQGELARRLQQIKQDRLTAGQKGVVSAPSTMNIAVPVIMGNYTDNAHIFTASDFQTLLFGANPTGSMTDYYDEVSYNQLHVTGTVYGPFTAAQNQAYYFNGNWGVGRTPPRNSAGFIVSVLNRADSLIDFRQFDNDGSDGVPNSGDDDGFVDAFIMIYPDGRGHWSSELPGIDADNLAVNTATISDYYGHPFATDDIGAGGSVIQIDFFAIIPAEKWDGTTDRILPIGVFCHEFAHQLGLPDLYDYDLDSWGVGNWCLMGFGTWGAVRDTTTMATPTEISAWCKSYMGWLTPTLITQTDTVEVPPVENTPTVYKMWEDGYQGGRYFLIENRTRTGFDKDLPGEGLLIWHCNEDECYDNSDNNFRLVDLEEADGLDFLNGIPLFGQGPTAGAMYPGSTNNTRFDDTTNPAATDVYGNATNLAIYDIAYVSGPGSPVRVTVRPRVTYGFTLSYHARSCDYFMYIRAPISGYGETGTRHGAVRFTSPAAGNLVAVRPVGKGTASVNFNVRVFDDIIGGSPQGFRTSSSANLVTSRNPRYWHVPLSSSVALAAGQTFVLDGSWGPDVSPVPVTEIAPISGQSFFSSYGTSFSVLANVDVAMRAIIRYACIDSSGVDDDVDGVLNACDNCVAAANADQADADLDSVGDACDNCTDVDGDGYANPGFAASTCTIDNCPLISNPGQEDANGDGIGDACCCVAAVGNVDCSAGDGVDVGDVTTLIDNLFINFTPLCCESEANCDGVGGVDVGDVTSLIDNLFINFTPLPACQ